MVQNIDENNNTFGEITHDSLFTHVIKKNLNV